MSELVIEAEWLDAGLETSREMAATWCQLAIYVNGVPLTANRVKSDSTVRNYLQVSAYPLAEWLAYNWSFLDTPFAGSAEGSGSEYSLGRLSRRAPNMRSAGYGFPWPKLSMHAENGDLVLRSEEGESLYSRVTNLASGVQVVSADGALNSLRRFVDSVIGRLEQTGVTRTRLQDEWLRLANLTEDQHVFRRVAAGAGLDPFFLSEKQTEQILSAGAVGLSNGLLLQLAPATDGEKLANAARWVDAGRRQMEELQRRRRGDVVDVAQLRQNLGVRENSMFDRKINKEKPWEIGYKRAEELRASLRIAATEKVDFTEFMLVQPAAEPAPGLIEAVVSSDAGPIAAVVDRGNGVGPRRFTNAQALARAVYGGTQGPQIIWHGEGLRHQMERAFAAEFLAPALGIAEIIGGDTSRRAKRAAAKRFGVSLMLVDFQINNRFLAA